MIHHDNELRFFLINLLILSVWTFSYTWMFRPGLELSFDIAADTKTVGQVYWSNGFGFSEKKKKVFKVSNQHRYVRFVLPSGIEKVRIDPIITEGYFYLREMKIGSRDCVFLPKRLCFQELPIENASFIDQIDIENRTSGNYFLSKGTDPKIQWQIGKQFDQSGIARYLTILIVQSILLAVALYAARRLLTQRSRLPGRDLASDLKHTPILCAPFLIAYVFSSVSVGAISQPAIDFLFLMSLFVFAASILGVLQRWSNHLTPQRVLGIFLVVGFLMPDFFFHLGLASRPFAGKELTEYHWRATRTYEDNFQHSPLKYIEDLNQISQIMSSDAIILSDIATSYYLASTTSAQGRFFYSHHRVPDFSIDNSQRADICRKILKRPTLNDSSWNFPQGIDYILLNLDRKNKNVAPLCEGDTAQQLISEILKDHSRLILRSDFFELYKLY